MKWLELAIALVVTGVLVTHIALPLAVRLFTSFRLTASELSPWRLRAVEWRNKAHASSPEPNWRIDLVHWSFGGSGAPGKLTLNIEGVTIRLRKNNASNDDRKTDAEVTAKKRKRLPSWLQAVVNYILHLVLHHWITAAGFLSVHISNVRVIVEELDNLEVRVSDSRLAFGQDVSTPIVFRSPLQPDEFSTSARASRPDHEAPAKPRARHASSPSISHISKAVWSHAIGNAIGRMAFSLRINDATVLLPQRAPSSTTSPPSTTPRRKRFSSLNTLLNKTKGNPSRPSETGYEKVAVLSSPSNVLLTLGIGPATEVFDQDNLKISVRLGNLQFSLDGLERVIEVNKTRKLHRPAPMRKKESRLWADGSLARRTARALEEVTLTCDNASVYQVFPTPQPGPPSSSVSEASDGIVSGHAISLDLSSLSVRLGATHSGIDPRLGKIFGTSQKINSQVHGITFSLSWTSIALHCVAPDETAEEGTELAAIRQADFDLLTTWRPDGFQRRETLFSDDPELSIIIARGCIASMDVAWDLQFMNELARSWKETHPRGSMPDPPRPKRSRPHLPKPPRIRVMVDLGRVSAVITNSASEDSATIRLSTDSLSLGGTSNFDDNISGSRDSISSHGGSFSEGNRAPPDDEKPSFGIITEAFATVEPIHLRMSLGQRDEKTYKLAKVGRIHVKTISHISGIQRTLESGDDEYCLLKDTLANEIEVLIDDGVKVELWHPDAINALVRAVHLKAPSSTPEVPKPHKDPLDVLPSGLSIRLAIPSVSLFLGHVDLHPSCSQRLVRGIWLQTTVVVDYARFRTMQARGSERHLRNLKMRDRLKLFKDVAASAFDHTQKLEHRGAQAALFSLVLSDTAVKTVFNGDAFVEKGGTENHMPPSQPGPPPPAEADLEFIAWGWSGAKRRETAPPVNHLRHLPKAFLSPTTLLRVPHIHITSKVHQPPGQEHSQIQLYGRVELFHIVAHISDVYCLLLAVHTVQTFTKAFKKSKPTGSAEVNSDALKARVPITLGLAVHRVWIHCYFPLQEQAFLAFENIGVERGSNKVTSGKADHVVLYIPSDTQPGYWDELGRIKRLTLSIDPTHIVNVGAAAFRIRIPYAFIFSQLIFNINMTIKTTKLILHNLKTGRFSMVKKPVSEPPKKLPHIIIRVDLLHFEARDHPVENKINLAHRVGQLEQQTRRELVEVFEHKLALMHQEGSARPYGSLTTFQTVSDDEALYRLRWHFSRNWVRRIRRSKAEQRRREEATHKRMHIQHTKLPIYVLKLEQTVPLFRFAFVGVNIALAPPNKSRTELIKYMGDVAAAPFKDDVQFSLMVPFDLTWTMTEAKVTLRDYPLPLLRIQPGKNKTPGWKVTTLFIIAEELSDDDSSKFFPIEVLPTQCGHDDAEGLVVNIAKAIMPTKTYARPMVKILCPDATRMTWCNSYKSGLSDLTRIFETLSNAPLDTSKKLGFWDKLRLTFHWRIIIDCAGSLRLFIKGSQDPYHITGLGAGFALIWRHNVCIEIGQPNSQRELVQIMADELLVSIPDLNVLQDQAAVGGTEEQPGTDEDEADRMLIERRSTKPCARFLNGARFGLGFVFERTCRPWTCEKGCGATKNKLHRQCRIFDFRPHNTVVLKNPKVSERLALAAGHDVDSYEGFRSDYIHFSVSLVAPRDPRGAAPMGSGAAAQTHSSIHMNPKASAHFFKWWQLFRSKIPAPIRQGPVFGSLPRSEKFGDALATIKYRCDIAPIYVSHMYGVSSEELWSNGIGESLGIKFRAGRFRLDGHQRQQEQRAYSAALRKMLVVTHKPFYACDLLLDELQLKGIVADFNETHTADSSACDEARQHVSDLDPDDRMWYNYFDFIDADSKPFDRNPRIQVVHMGECPHVFLSRKIKALKTKADDADHDLPPGKEASKFGHEKTHVCYLGAAMGVGPMQMQIAQERVVDLQEMLVAQPEPTSDQDVQYIATLKHRINILNHHIDDLAQTENRQMDFNTLQDNDEKQTPQEDDGETMFDNTLHVHCPRLFFNNDSRNVLYKYLYARRNRKAEEYTTSYAALRSIRDSVNRRRARSANGLNRDDLENLPTDVANELLKVLEKRVEDGNTRRFTISEEFLDNQGTTALPEQGLPADCSVHPKWRMLVLKPQIALRSTADPAAIVLVALQEMAIKTYNIIDDKALDDVVSEILSRSYVAAKSLQAFYPAQEIIARGLKAKSDFRKELDFVPLEIFLDSKSEATDYDRVILRTDMSVSWDEFNRLRAPRGLEWPKIINDFGDPIEHLRLHQNSKTICIPFLTVSAKATHWTALYYVVTDLMIWTLPEKRQRKEKVDTFLLKFDRRDRDPQQLLWSLMGLQAQIHHLAELQRGYQSNLDRLTAEGRRELFTIRADMLKAYEQLNTVFEVINLNRTYEEAREALQTKSRIDVRAGDIAWHMQRMDGMPLLKLNIKRTLFAMSHNQDGSKDLAVAVSDLQALNSNSEAVFTEVMTKSPKDHSRDTRRDTNCFMSASFSTLPQVGGISIVRELALYLHPVRFRLEQAVGDAVVAYLFNDQTKQAMGRGGGSHGHSNGGPAHQSMEVLPIPRNQSQATLASTSSGPRSLGWAAQDHKGADDDAEEMRRRAADYRTYMNLIVGSTYFILDYKRDETKNKHGMIPEVADFKLFAPEFNYQDKVWSGKDILENVRKDLIRSVWSQRGDLVTQMMMKTSMFRSKKHLRQIAGLNTEVGKHKGGSAKSPLRFSSVNSTQLDLDEDDPPSPTGQAPSSTDDTVITRRNTRRYSVGHSNGDGDADDEGDPKRRGLFQRLRRTSRGEGERRESKGGEEEVLQPQRTRRSVGQQGYRRSGSADYGGGASLRSSRSGQSAVSTVSHTSTPDTHIRRAVSNGNSHGSS